MRVQFQNTRWAILLIHMKFKIYKEKAKESNLFLNKEKDKNQLNSFHFLVKTDFTINFTILITQ
jgi:hypothetical protein